MRLDPESYRTQLEENVAAWERTFGRPLTPKKRLNLAFLLAGIRRAARRDMAARANNFERTHGTDADE